MPVEVRPDAAHEHRVAVDEQVLRRDGARHVGARLEHELHALLGREVLEDHAQPGRALEYLRRLVGVVRARVRARARVRVRVSSGAWWESGWG